MPIKQINFFYNKKILFLISCSFIISCNSHLSFDAINENYQKDKYTFITITNDFISNNLNSFIRIPANKNPYFLCGSSKNINYTFIVTDKPINKAFTIDLVFKNEREEAQFWDQDFQNIVETGKGNYTLTNFLNEYHIPKESFKRILNFIIEYDIHGIYKTGDYIIFSFSLDEGLVYFPNNDNKKPSYGSTNGIKEVDKNWYYFRKYD